MRHDLLTGIVRWDITAQCNLACRHCYIPKKVTQELKTHDAFEILKIVLKRGLSELNLSGREPTMRADLPRIIDWCYSHGVKVNLVTNGTLLNKPLLSSMAFGLNIVNYSIDGPTALIHDKLRGVGNFKRAVENIMDCLSYVRKHEKHVQIGVSCTLTRFNFRHMSEMIHFGKSLDIDFLAINPVTFCGSAHSARSLLGLSADDISCALDEACREYSSVRPAFRLNLGVFPMEIRFLNLKYDLNLPMIQNGCIAGHTIYIAPDGKAYACYMLPPIAQVKPKVRKYLIPWDILRERDLNLATRFQPFLDFVRSHNQKHHPNCQTCSDKEVCKPCPLLVELDDGMLVRCKKAKNQIVELMPTIKNHSIPNFRHTMAYHVENGKLNIRQEQDGHTHEMIFEINPLTEYVIRTINGRNSVYTITKILAERQKRVSSGNLRKHLTALLEYLWQERIIAFNDNHPRKA